MFQRVTLIGRVGQDPEMRYTPDGTPVVNFSVATSSFVSKSLPGGNSRKCPDGWKESYDGNRWELTTWWRITAWRRLAERVRDYVGKGDIVLIEGKVSGTAANGTLYPRTWVANDGKPRANFELTASMVKVLHSMQTGVGDEEYPEGDLDAPF